MGELKPPEKSKPYRKFDTSNSKEMLQEGIQHSWWKTKPDEHCNAIIDSKYRDANFALSYNKFLSETSNNLIRYKVPTTITEQHVMRELLWMFHMPQKCTVFTLDQDNQLKVNDNVSIPSCSVVSFNMSLLPKMKIFNNFFF